MKRIWCMLIALAPLANAGDSPDRQAWLADFEQLKSLLATNYPNLEWQAQRGIDLPALAARARSLLERAGDDAEARAVFERFLARFGDAHLSIEWDAHPPDPADDPALPDCVRFGFRDDADTRAIARLLEGYEDITPNGGTIGAGFVTVDGRLLAVLRVPSFVPSRVQCEQYLRARGAAARAPGSALAAYEDAIGTGVSRLYLAEAEERLRQLGARRPAALLVDVAGNGGGKQLAITLARMLGGDAVRNPVVAFVREPLRARNLAARTDAIRSALRRAPRRERAFLDSLIAPLELAGREAARPCELAPLWRGEPVSCSNLVAGPFFAGGLVDHELPEEWLDKPWADEVSFTAEYGVHARAWSGPVLVLVDDGSASATELFAAMLQDARAALVIGAPTLGAGCGWTMGQYESSKRLTHSQARVMIPDCARIRADGGNELDGVQPDLLIGLRRGDTPRQRAQRVAARLPEALGLVGVRSDSTP
jgi:hypothetical protein